VDPIAAKPAEDIEMKMKIDAKDEELKKVFDDVVAEAAKTSGFNKLMPFNKPLILIPLASIGAAINGSAMPIFGMFFSFILTILTAPKDVLEALHGPTYIEDRVKIYAGSMGLLAIISSVASFIQKLSFGTLGNNVTG
jgi:hypothetical protein